MILIVVAHPDDESFWFGGTIMILSKLGFKILVVCLTNSENYRRAEEFKSACHKLNIDGIILNCQDGGIFVFVDIVPRLEDILNQKKILKKEIDCIVTHAPHGNERGHPQHKQCFEMIQGWANSQDLPFGFYSELLYPELRLSEKKVISNNITVFSCTLSILQFVKDLLLSLFRDGLDISKITQRIKIYGKLKKFNYLAIFKINRGGKYKLLQSYKSQFQRLKEYKTYLQKTEILVVDKKTVINQIIDKYAIYIKKTTS